MHVNTAKYFCITNTAYNDKKLNIICLHAYTLCRTQSIFNYKMTLQKCLDFLMK